MSDLAGKLGEGDSVSGAIYTPDAGAVTQLPVTHAGGAASSSVGVAHGGGASAVSAVHTVSAHHVAAKAPTSARHQGHAAARSHATYTKTHKVHTPKPRRVTGG